MSRHLIRSADGRLTAVLAGDAEALPRAPLLVCIHGGGCSARYFDLKGFSTVDRALKRNLPVLLIDRPGHGASPPAKSEQPLDEAALLIPPFVQEVRRGRAVVMIGHSIGGAVALKIAASQQPWLQAVAVSGIGDRISEGLEEAWSRGGPGSASDPDPSFFFGPEGTFRWNAPAALRRASEPWQMEEVFDVVRGWPNRFSVVAQEVRVPVHLRLAEHERIWETGGAAIRRMASGFTAAAKVDAAVLPEGGHLYELHKRGAELIESQLEFLSG